MYFHYWSAACENNNNFIPKVNWTRSLRLLPGKNAYHHLKGLLKNQAKDEDRGGLSSRGIFGSLFHKHCLGFLSSPFPSTTLKILLFLITSERHSLHRQKIAFGSLYRCLTWLQPSLPSLPFVYSKAGQTLACFLVLSTAGCPAGQLLTEPFWKCTGQQAEMGTAEGFSLPWWFDSTYWVE